VQLGELTIFVMFFRRRTIMWLTWDNRWSKALTDGGSKCPKP